MAMVLIGTTLIAWPSMPASAAIQCNSTDLESRHHGSHAMVTRFEALVILQSETMNSFSASHCNLLQPRW